MNPSHQLRYYIFHPLIHTFLGFAQAQNVEKKSEAEAPHFLSLNQDIVAMSQVDKCGLKYVIHISWIRMDFRLSRLN
jgi:hypothetical protein